MKRHFQFLGYEATFPFCKRPIPGTDKADKCPAVALGGGWALLELTDAPGGVLAEKLGRGVRPTSQNPYPIYDQNLRFSLPYL